MLSILHALLGFHSLVYVQGSTSPVMEGYAIWTQTFGGEKYDFCSAIVESQDSGYIMGGGTSSWSDLPGFTFDGFLAKFDSNGYLLWNQTYGGEGEDHISDLIQTSDGEIVFTGTLNYNDYESKNVWLVKTDRFGEVLWSYTLGGNFSEQASSLIETSTGEIIVASNSRAKAYTNELWITKVNSTGAVQWSNKYGLSDFNTRWDICQTSDDEFVVAGESASFDARFVKIDSNGEILWDYTFGGYYSDEIYAVTPTSDHGFAATGKTYSFGSKGTWVIKISENGNVEWHKTYGGAVEPRSYGSGQAIVQTSDEKIAIASKTNENICKVIKLEMNGSIIWEFRYGGSPSDKYLRDYYRPKSLIATQDGNLTIAGDINPGEGGKSDIFLQKIGSREKMPSISFLNSAIAFSLFLIGICGLTVLLYLLITVKKK